jgi:hypothetical protein
MFSGVKSAGSRKRPEKQSTVSTSKRSPGATVPIGACAWLYVNCGSSQEKR